MATARAVIGRALRAISMIAPGDDPAIDELKAGVEAVHRYAEGET